MSHSNGPSSRRTATQSGGVEPSRKRARALGPASISALVIARNEGANLAECLASVSWADESVVVVDASSRDDTLEIAQREADGVVVRAFDDFASQRNAGLEAARGAWILAVDADERVTSGLALEIRAALDASRHAASVDDRAHAPCSGYRVPIRSVVLGRRFRFSGTQDDLPLRLFRRDRGRWVGAVHETVDLSGAVETLREHIEHCTIPDLNTFLAKINKYTTLEAIKLEQAGRRPSLFDLVARPIYTFMKLYFAKQGFRDGWEGFVFCSLSGVSDAVRHWKLRERLASAGGSAR